MAVVVLDMVALVFECVKDFIFNFPADTTAFDQVNYIIFIDSNIGHPAISVGDLVIGDDVVLEKIDFISILCAI